MSTNVTLLTAGGRITCLQCNAKSKRTSIQCRAPAAKGKTKCRFHGGASTGPKTEFGRQRCAAARTIHGFETRRERTERALGMRRLRELEDLGHALGILRGSRTPGRKPQ
uniref:HGGxSTG domain-containing protein n=1 Tax=Limnohabitans sp. TaxID=1907725 RepID=UPI00404897FE